MWYVFLGGNFVCCLRINNFVVVLFSWVDGLLYFVTFDLLVLFYVICLDLVLDCFIGMLFVV